MIAERVRGIAERADELTLQRAAVLDQRLGREGEPARPDPARPEAEEQMESSAGGVVWGLPTGDQIRPGRRDTPVSDQNCGLPDHVTHDGVHDLVAPQHRGTGGHPQRSATDSRILRLLAYFLGDSLLGQPSPGRNHTLSEYW